MSRRLQQRSMYVSRIRAVKPEVFLHESLYDLEMETKLPVRFAWIGLWTRADREGRFRWQPRSLKATILPYDDIDFSRVLHAWFTRGLIVKYSKNGEDFGYIPSWPKHQHVNYKEPPSSLPAPDDQSVTEGNKQAALPLTLDFETTREPRVNHACSTSGSRVTQGKERKDIQTESIPYGIDSVSPEQDSGAKKGTTQILHLSLPLSNGTAYPVTTQEIERLQGFYPFVNVAQEVRSMAAWLQSNPRKRKKLSGIKRFMNGWLQRENQKTPARKPAGERKQNPDGSKKL